jgi:hypothetical protein
MHTYLGWEHVQDFALQPLWQHIQEVHCVQFFFTSTPPPEGGFPPGQNMFALLSRQTHRGGKMSVQGELYRSYDSYVDGRMYMSTGSEGSVMQHQVRLAWPPPTLASASLPPTYCSSTETGPARSSGLACCVMAILSNDRVSDPVIVFCLARSCTSS